MFLENGYETKTTFWQDFSIADRFGEAAIKDTYKRAFTEWKYDVVYLTELSLVLNHKCWEWFEKNIKISTLYGELWEKVNDYAYETLSGDDIKYYFAWTD